MAKIQSLKTARTRAQEAINSLIVVRKEDVKARKKARATKKPKYTESIKNIDLSISEFKIARDNLIAIPKRIA